MFFFCHFLGQEVSFPTHFLFLRPLQFLPKSSVQSVPAPLSFSPGLSPPLQIRLFLAGPLLYHFLFLAAFLFCHFLFQVGYASSHLLFQVFLLFPKVIISFLRLLLDIFISFKPVCPDSILAVVHILFIECFYQFQKARFRLSSTFYGFSAPYRGTSISINSAGMSE